MARKLNFDKAIINDMKTAAEGSYADNIKMLPIEQLHDNEKNFYKLSDLEILAEDIDRQGLKTPLYVVPFGDGSAEYTIISGHRRKAAVQLLIENGKYTSGKLPCYIGTVEKSEAEMKLDLIMLNATARVISDAETMQQYQELVDCFKQLEEEGIKFSGKMREKIAAVMQVSPAQVGKIENIRNNAISEIVEAVEEGKMSISTANEAAKLEPETQKDLIERKKPEEITHKEVKEARQQKTGSGNANVIEVDPEVEYGEQEVQQLIFDDEIDEAAKAELAQLTALRHKPEEYFDEIIDSGMCNSIISGYILLALDELDIHLTDKQLGSFSHTINRMFDNMGSQQARKRRKEIQF